MLMQILAFSAATGFAQTTAQTGIDKANMDLSVKPGNDFYQYAAGGWIERHPLTPEFSRYSQFDELQENNQKQLREMIEQFANNTYPQGSLQQKIGSLYRLSMDSVRRNREGYTPIKGKLAEIEKLPTVNRCNTTPHAFQAKACQHFSALAVTPTSKTRNGTSCRSIKAAFPWENATTI